MKKLIKVLMPLVLIVAMSSFLTPGLRAAQPDDIAVSQGASTSTLTVYIDQLNINKDGGTVTVDPIQWYEGEAAEVAFQANEPDAGIDGPPDGYYIVNDDEQLTRYPVAKDAEVLMQIYDRTGNLEDMDIQWNELISLEKFGEIFSHNELIDLSQFPYHITIKDGQVVRIVQQFIP
ncbi:hypothetical protein GCM10008013_36340 [Paenibacillus segetis]|uniref:Uncharacterized protein n=2 Tax=Paenibacillus segetis TaxID=1325360 RepID=A0ABQ1YNN0_9BACL|nr:hypothetical protein GCM10008013_36340 [Paenibacillus segetis]